MVELVGIEPFQWIENIQLTDSTMFSKVKKGTNSNSAVQIGTRTSCRLLHTSTAQTKSRTYSVSTKLRSNLWRQKIGNGKSVILSKLRPAQATYRAGLPGSEIGS